MKTFVFHQDPVAVYPETFLARRLGRDRVNSIFGGYWAFLRWLSSHYDATVVSGHWLAEKLSGFDIKRPEAVPFGIAKTEFSPALSDAEVRADLLARCGAPEDAQLLVTVSRFHPEKRLSTLLSAVERVGRERPIALVVFGGGPLEKMVRRRADRIPGVHVAGYTSNRRELAVALASADAFLHGSAAETFGLVVAEAICSGLPLVVPDVGGAADLADPTWAETYPPGDAAACAAAIDRVHARDRADLTDALARAARDRIGTMDDHFDGLFALYERLVAERRGS